MNNVKKRISFLLCFMMLLPCLLIFTACGGNKLTDNDWARVGLKSNTIDLTAYKIDNVKRVNNRTTISLSITLNDTTLDDFDVIANQCYENIPANKDVNGDEVDSIDEIKFDTEEIKVFTAYYTINGADYLCNITYLLSDYVSPDGTKFKQNQMVVAFAKIIETTNNIGHDFWETESTDKTWLTKEEASKYSLPYLPQPEGNILGKEVYNDSVAIYMENISEEEYRNFTKILYVTYKFNERLGSSSNSNFEDFFFETYNGSIFEANKIGRAHV